MRRVDSMLASTAGERLPSGNIIQNMKEMYFQNKLPIESLLEGILSNGNESDLSVTNWHIDLGPGVSRLRYMDEFMRFAFGHRVSSEINTLSSHGRGGFIDDKYKHGSWSEFEFWVGKHESERISIMKGVISFDVDQNGLTQKDNVTRYSVCVLPRLADAERRPELGRMKQDIEELIYRAIEDRRFAVMAALSRQEFDSGLAEHTGRMVLENEDYEVERFMEFIRRNTEEWSIINWHIDSMYKTSNDDFIEKIVNLIFTERKETETDRIANDDDTSAEWKTLLEMHGNATDCNEIENSDCDYESEIYGTQIKFTTAKYKLLDVSIMEVDINFKERDIVGPRSHVDAVCHRFSVCPIFS